MKKAGNETEWGGGEGVERKLIKRAGGKYNYIYNIQYTYVLYKYATQSSGIHCKKRLAIFPSSAGMALTKLSAGNNDIPEGDGKIANLFFTVYSSVMSS